VADQYWYKKPTRMGLMEKGPYSLAEMRQLYRQGELGRAHQVSIDGGEVWQAAQEFPELFQRQAAPAPPPPPPPPPPEEQRPSEWEEIDLGLEPEPSQSQSPPADPNQAGPVINVHASQTREHETNGMAVAGFVLSLLGFTCLTALLGFIFSLVALNSNNRANRGLAIAGAIISGLWLLAWLVYILIVIVLVAAQARA
jgi:hypothetical protein